LPAARPQWAKQFAVVVSRIGRFDWPKAWPDLFPGILAAVQSPEPAQAECALGCLHQSLKELAAKRTHQDRKLFEQVGPRRPRHWSPMPHAQCPWPARAHSGPSLP